VKTTVVRWSARLYDPDTVFIGRPSKWGNPFHIGRDGDRTAVIEKYIWWFIAPERAALRAAAIHELRGKKLACYCHPKLCHGHVLAHYVDSGEGDYNLYTRARFAVRV